VVAGEGPWFNSQLNLAAFDGGKVTALTTLDSTPIIMKESGVWYIDGEPPTDLGVSTIGAPRRVQTEAGCTDSASVVSTSHGVARMALNGIYMLDRSLIDRPIGKNVEDSYPALGYSGACVLPSQGLIRWTLRDANYYKALNLDSYHGELYSAAVWSRDVTALSRIAYASTVWNGDFVWISDYGVLYREDDTTFTDNGTWVTMSFECGFAKPAGLAAYQRVQRVFITGNRETHHNMTVTLTADTGTETRTWAALEIDELPSAPVERFQVHVAAQKNQWLKVKIVDATPTSLAVTTGEGFALRDVSILVGVKPGGARLSGQK